MTPVLRAIVESLAEHAPRSQDPDALAAQAHPAVARAIVRKRAETAPVLAVTTPNPALERLLLSTVQGGETAGLEPTLAQRLRDVLAEARRRQEHPGQVPVALVPWALRLWLACFARIAHPRSRRRSESMDVKRDCAPDRARDLLGAAMERLRGTPREPTEAMLAQSFGMGLAEHV